MSEEEAVETVAEVLVRNGIAQFSAQAIARQVVRALK